MTRKKSPQPSIEKKRAEKVLTHDDFNIAANDFYAQVDCLNRSNLQHLQSQGVVKPMVIELLLDIIDDLSPVDKKCQLPPNQSLTTRVLDTLLRYKKV